MSDTQVAGDSKYLFKRDKTWWVKLSVPRPLRPVLGYDLRRSLHTHDIEVARESRWSAIEEFRHKIEKISTIQTGGPAESSAAAATDDSSVTAQTKPGVSRVSQAIVEIVSDSGEGAQKCGQLLGLVSGKMGNGVWTVEIIPAEIQPPARERQGASGIRVRMGSGQRSRYGRRV